MELGEKLLRFYEIVGVVLRLFSDNNVIEGSFSKKIEKWPTLTIKNKKSEVNENYRWKWHELSSTKYQQQEENTSIDYLSVRNLV